MSGTTPHVSWACMHTLECCWLERHVTDHMILYHVPGYHSYLSALYLLRLHVTCAKKLS
jgi:hypothetical protein